MAGLGLNFGTLIELVEDWLRKNSLQCRVMARIVDGKDIVEISVGGAYFVSEQKKIYLVTKAPKQGDIFDDDSILLNDESPGGIYRDLKELESQEIDYSTSLGIEIWFTDGEDDIQYRLECESYSINQDFLIVEHFLGKEKVEFDDEFRQMLHEQY